MILLERVEKMTEENQNSAYNSTYASGSNQSASSVSNEGTSSKPTVSLPMETSTSSPTASRTAESTHDASQSQSFVKSNIQDSARSPYPSQGAPSHKDPFVASENATQSAQQVFDANSTAGQSAVSKNKSLGKVFVVAFIGALIACILFFAIGTFAGVFGTKTTIGSSGSSTSTITASDTSSSLAEQVASKCLPSVVSVNVYGNAKSSASSILDFFNGGGSSQDSQELTQTSTGSGVIMSKDGYIITNQHVISGGKKYEVVVNGETKEAKLVGQDASSDVAVLKVDTDKELTPVELGDSDSINTGEWVMSIGNPFGLEQSVATGIISATSRSQIVDSSNSNSQSSGQSAIYPNMIQTDAAINPGNSGGALVNEKGQLIGINTLITSYSGNYSGVGFAIPVNYAIGIAKNLIEGKNPTYAQLGVSLSTINETYAKRFGFAVNEGAYVADVSNSSGAAKAGIQKGDIITEFGGEKVTSASDLILDVRKKQPGDKVSIKFYRGNEQKTVEVELGEGESTTSSNSSQNSQ